MVLAMGRIEENHRDGYLYVGDDGEMRGERMEEIMER